MRPDRQEEEEVSNDSFLDVVANVVGVLVILVMLIGARASQATLIANGESPSPGRSVADAPTQTDLAKLQEQLDEETREAISVRQAVENAAVKISRLQREAKSSDRQRVALAMHRQVVEEDLAKRRSQLDAERQAEFDVQRQLMESKVKLGLLTEEHLSLASQPDPAETIECMPTPMAKEVEESAIHLRVRKGMVSIVPIEQLDESFRNQRDSILRRLQSSNEVIETVGPIDGYRARLRLVKREAVVSGLSGTRREFVLEPHTQYVPISEDIGQNIEQALLPGSVVHDYLESRHRESPPVEVWLYADSFQEFQSLKRALRDWKYSISIRPMPLGASISSSPYGSKSAVQ